MASASHIHADEFAPDSPSTACSFCLSLPVGAPSPAHVPDVQRVLIAEETRADVAATLVVVELPSSYLSRGPPAR